MCKQGLPVDLREVTKVAAVVVLVQAGEDSVGLVRVGRGTVNQRDS